MDYEMEVYQLERRVNELEKAAASHTIMYQEAREGLRDQDDGGKKICARLENLEREASHARNRRIEIENRLVGIDGRLKKIEGKSADHEDRLNGQRSWLKQNDEKFQSLISCLDAMESVMGTVARVKAEGEEIEAIRKEERRKTRERIHGKIQRHKNGYIAEIPQVDEGFLQGIRAAQKIIETEHKEDRI